MYEDLVKFFIQEFDCKRYIDLISLLDSVHKLDVDLPMAIKIYKSSGLPILRSIYPLSTKYKNEKVTKAQIDYIEHRKLKILSKEDSLELLNLSEQYNKIKNRLFNEVRRRNKDIFFTDSMCEYTLCHSFQVKLILPNQCICGRSANGNIKSLDGIECDINCKIFKHVKDLGFEYPNKLYEIYKHLTIKIRIDNDDPPQDNFYLPGYFNIESLTFKFLLHKIHDPTSILDEIFLPEISKIIMENFKEMSKKREKIISPLQMKRFSDLLNFDVNPYNSTVNCPKCMRGIYKYCGDYYFHIENNNLFLGSGEERIEGIGYHPSGVGFYPLGNICYENRFSHTYNIFINGERVEYKKRYPITDDLSIERHYNNSLEKLTELTKMILYENKYLNH